MDKMVISAEIAEELLELRGGEYLGGYRKIADVEVSSGRWMGYHMLVFTNGTGFFAFDYYVGLTEYQADYYPWEDEDEVEIYPVVPHTVTSVEYRKAT